MKFVVDECTGPAVARWLEQEGHNVVSIYDTARGSDDDHVLSLAFAQERVLITSDKDFGDLIFRENRLHHGLVLLRLNDQRSSSYIAALERLFRRNHPLIDQFVVVTNARIRVR